MKNPMRIPPSAALVMLCAIAGSCAPEEKCSGERYFEVASGLCFSCPMDATLKNGTCKCKDKYEFKNRRCVLKDGETDEPMDAGKPNEKDAGMMSEEDTGMSMPAGPTCADYCGFAKACIGDNMLAKAALPTIITGLHADDVDACTDNCQSELGNDGSSDPAVACIEAGREAAMCAGVSTQDGLASGLMLVADCCRPRKSNALCKSICVPLKANPLTSSMVDFCD
jgi:hypothetical protein